MDLLVSRQGDIRCLYDEAVDLGSLGRLTITRGSHVEPDKSGQWFADLSPVSGPQLGPFSLRSDALAAERDWLHANWLLSSGTT
jgi:hypothetical protein